MNSQNIPEHFGLDFWSMEGMNTPGYQYQSFKNQSAWRRASIIMSLTQIIKLILVDAMIVLTCEATCLHLKMSTSKVKQH